MPVRLESKRSSYDAQGGFTWPRRKPPTQFSERPGHTVRIGLVNNMPHAAFTATERQFISLLDSASEGITVQLSLYTLPGIPRPDPSMISPDSSYASADTLWDKSLDGLIVTGKEPLTPNLKDEPCWQSFAQVVDWARKNTYSSVWSCLAAHGAVLHLDGIGRRRNHEKHFGVLECTGAEGHPLRAGAPARFMVPHSRWNGLSEEELTAGGYTVLSRNAGAGVDTFVKEENCLFVFFQGHPEYESDTLLREYRRDAGRFLRGEAPTYPLVPLGYFDESTENALNALREKALSSPSEELFSSVGNALEATKIENTWHRTAAKTYRNWLEYICARKSASELAGDAHVA
jgi:homoserine O-succinyltransferase